MQTIKAKFHYYRLDISKDDEAEKYYNEILPEIEKHNIKCWVSLCYNTASDYHRKYKKRVKEIAEQGFVELETKFVFENQWNEKELRVHDWLEWKYPNARIKEGYWIEPNEETKKAREPKTYIVEVFDGTKTAIQAKVKAINSNEATNIVYHEHDIPLDAKWKVTLESEWKETTELQLQEQIDAERQKLIDKINRRYDDKIEKANLNRRIDLAIAEHFGIKDNHIYYEHQNELVFNWKDYGDKFTSEEIESFKLAGYELPDGIVIKDGK